MEKIKIDIGKHGDEDVIIDAQKLVTGRTCVIAQSGAGKCIASDTPIILSSGEIISAKEVFERINL